MFEATTEIVFESPLTIVALLPVLYLTASVLWRIRKPLAYLITITAVICLFPVFLLFAVGEFTGSAVWMSIGTDVFRLEAAVAGGIVRLYDGLLAAWLRVFALVIDSVLSIDVLPAELEALLENAPVSTGFVWISAFVLHFAGGVILVYGLYRGRGTSSMESLLRGGGVAFLIAGLFVVLVQGHVLNSDTSVVGVLLMAVLGLETGVGTVLLGLQPDFSADSDDEVDSVTSVVWAICDSFVSRFGMLVHRSRSDIKKE